MSSPSFPGSPSSHLAPPPVSAVRVQRHPDRPKSPVVPVARPVNRPSSCKPAVINWRMVGLGGAIAWLWVIGLVMGAWVMSGHAKPRVAAVAPAKQETVLAFAQPKEIVSRHVPAKPPAPELIAAPTPVENDKKLERAAEAVAAQFIDPAEAPEAKKAEKAEPNASKCGTAVAFLDDPSKAMKQAQKDEKLLFLVHVAGDFDDPGFT